jgi:hypothetical protein
MEQTKICAACELELPLSEFWGDKSYNDGRSRRCKTCFRTKKLIPPENKLQKYKEQTMKDILKGQYGVVYSFLESIGYDLSIDIHQQFLDRHNQYLEVPMKYQKKRKSDMPAFFPDGTYNEEYKYRSKYLKDL